MYNHQELS